MHDWKVFCISYTSLVCTVWSLICEKLLQTAGKKIRLIDPCKMEINRLTGFGKFDKKLQGVHRWRGGGRVLHSPEITANKWRQEEKALLNLTAHIGWERKGSLEQQKPAYVVMTYMFMHQVHNLYAAYLHSTKKSIQTWFSKVFPFFTLKFCNNTNWNCW